MMGVFSAFKARFACCAALNLSLLLLAPPRTKRTSLLSSVSARAFPGEALPHSSLHAMRAQKSSIFREGLKRGTGLSESLAGVCMDKKEHYKDMGRKKGARKLSSEGDDDMNGGKQLEQQPQHHEPRREEERNGRHFVSRARERASGRPPSLVVVLVLPGGDVVAAAVVRRTYSIVPENGSSGLAAATATRQRPPPPPPPSVA